MEEWNIVEAQLGQAESAAGRKRTREEQRAERRAAAAAARAAEASDGEGDDDDDDLRDPYDEDLYRDDADRAAMEELPEVEREKILAERYEERLMLQERRQQRDEDRRRKREAALQEARAKRRSRTAQAAAAAYDEDDDDPGRVLDDGDDDDDDDGDYGSGKRRKSAKAARAERSRAEALSDLTRRRRHGRDHEEGRRMRELLGVSSDEEESDDDDRDAFRDSDLSDMDDDRVRLDKPARGRSVFDQMVDRPASLQEIATLQLRFEDVVPWLEVVDDEATLERLVGGLYVRVSAGSKHGKPYYVFAEVMSVHREASSYDARKHSSQTSVRTPFTLVCAHGSPDDKTFKRFRLHYLSSNLPEAQELERWSDQMHQHQQELPSLRRVQRLRDRLGRVRRGPEFREALVQKLIKRRTGKVGGVAQRRADLQTKAQILRDAGDVAGAEAAEAEALRLAREGAPSDKADQVLRRINERNRAANLAAARAQAAKARQAGEDEDGGADPFQRRLTRPKRSLFGSNDTKDQVEDTPEDRRVRERKVEEERERARRQEQEAAVERLLQQTVNASGGTDDMNTEENWVDVGRQTFWGRLGERLVAGGRVDAVVGGAAAAAGAAARRRRPPMGVQLPDPGVPIISLDDYVRQK